MKFKGGRRSHLQDGGEAVAAFINDGNIET